LSQPYKIEFTKSARKEFLKLPSRTQSSFEDMLHVLSRNPFTEILKIKKIKGQVVLYRVRSGDYRMVYFIDRQEIIVLVVKLGYRSEVYGQF